MLNKEQYDNLRKSILNDNKILFVAKDWSATETCMCWGLEVSDFWLEHINDLCQKLEALNYIYYPKFGVRIQADQVKEKMGNLTFYYSIMHDPPKFICLYEKIVDKIINLLSKINFKTKYEVINPAFDSIEKRSLTYEECKKETKYGIASNVKFISNNNGTITKEIKLHHHEIGRHVATRFKIFHKILQYKYDIHSFFRKVFRYSPTYKQLCIGELLDEKTSKYIDEAVEKCEHTCEKCGRQIGTDWSPLCTTFGWISYICKECADKQTGNYIMNGEVWNSGKCIMTKEEYQKKKEERFAKMNQQEDEDEDNEE